MSACNPEFNTLKMPHNFFISHYSGDKEAAEIIANAIQRVSLKQMIPWFSSDVSSSGGLKPGSIWFSEIISRITASRAVVVLLTPNSLKRQWIYFESGIAEALNNCEVIPVCIGMKKDSVPPPLGIYQCYQLGDYRAINEFCGKLLNKFDISFDEEMSRQLLEKTIVELSRISFKEPDEGVAADNITTAALINDLKSHIDKRLIEVLNNQQSRGASYIHHEDSITPPKNFEYSISIKINFPLFKENQFIDIRASDTVADVFDVIWHLVSDYVAPFTYLEKWIMIDKQTNRNLIIREIASMIPASVIFTPDIIWHVEKLDVEYRGGDSTSKGYHR